MGKVRFNKKPKDPRGNFIQLYHEMVNSPAWLCMGASTMRVYIAMRSAFNKFNNGDISATLNGMKAHGVRSSATLAKALRELEALGFIDKTRQGGIAAGGKICSLYRFTDEEVFEQKGLSYMSATNEWKLIRNKAHARAILRDIAVAQEKAKVHKKKLADSKIESNSENYGSNIEEGLGTTV